MELERRMATIQITFPDGSVQEFPQGITAREVAQGIGSRLAAEALAAKVNGQLVDLSSPIEARHSLLT
jgi:threonyl-tRNA synthetase